jgi:ATP-binding cassette subfamily B protein
MDCGPAALKCLLEGFGVRISYGRLREACQTDVDGTSIDTMEEAARHLGLDANQIMVPADHLLLPEAKALPALVVVRLPSGAPHFVVVWRRHGPILQLMDPATGRRWLTSTRFLQELFIHSHKVPAEAWREWAGSESFLILLRARLRSVGIPAHKWIDAALLDKSWRSLAKLDAATRMVDLLVRSGGVRRGSQATRLLEKLLEQDERIPAEYWSVQQAGENELTFRGAVLIQVRGRLRVEQRQDFASPELAAALAEPPARPGLHLLKMLAADGAFAPLSLLLAIVLAAGAVLVEAVLFRGLLDVGLDLEFWGQRFGAAIALVLFLVLLLLLDLPLTSGLLRCGRRLEMRLRLAFLQKIPKLTDRYFQSRLKSDMTDRSHSLHQVRHLPELGGRFVRGVFELIFTVAGIVWLDAASLPLAVVAASVAFVLPLILQPLIVERDLRFRNHAGAVTRFYLDALLGLVPIRIHGAERLLRREQAEFLGKWAVAGLDKQRLVAWSEAIQFFAGFGLAASLLIGHLSRNAEAGGVLLLAYWTLNLPVIGQDTALAAWQYPAHRNITLRLLEPLGAPEDLETPDVAPANAADTASEGMLVEMQNVQVRAAGRTILADINLRIESGSHVAIVGASGAGKSSIVGLLLGWHRAASGKVRLDGCPIDGRIGEIRRQTAWIDPAVQIWNRSFLENLTYGNDSSGVEAADFGHVIDGAQLIHVLEKLPDGFETPLGEGGALVSGGEGQRVRLARAMLRPEARLVILDEAFRGLDRDQRQQLLSRSRELWCKATMLCITHDVSQTRSFDRVVVVEGGRIIEDGNPAELIRDSNSRYRALLDAEQQVLYGLWDEAGWRRIRLEKGTLHAS